MATIRNERPEDLSAIREINRLAFGRTAEADLVDRLRSEGRVVASLVGEDEGSIVGHILFSALRIYDGPSATAAAALAPMAVHPQRQRSGIDSALVRAGLDDCRARGMAAVIVLGHTSYYPRFGFSAEAASLLEAPSSGSGFMALPLGDDVRLTGRVEYPQAFFEIED